MGMYDTINGEQVKCFPWVSLYDNQINYHGGDLAYYDTGSEVPYKRPHYNYGKNFVILDLNRFPESDYCPYDYILHVVVDGKVKDTFENEIGYIDWSIIQSVVGYTGELLNVHSSEDLLSYMAAQRKFWEDYEKIRSHWNELFSELIKCMHGFGLLDKESEERKIRKENFNKIHELMKEEEKRIQPELNALTEKHSELFVDDYDDLIELGNYIAAYGTEVKIKSLDNTNKCKEMIMKLLSEDKTLYDRYVEWQGSDEYINEFKYE